MFLMMTLLKMLVTLWLSHGGDGFRSLLCPNFVLLRLLHLSSCWGPRLLSQRHLYIRRLVGKMSGAHSYQGSSMDWPDTVNLRCVLPACTVASCCSWAFYVCVRNRSYLWTYDKPMRR